MSSASLNIQIFETDRETQVDKLVETLEIDISCLLFPKENIDFTWHFDKLKTLQLHYLTFTVKCPTPLLSELLRKKLNPMQINLVACKDIPFKTEPRFKPIFAACEFVDGQNFRTLEMP